MRVVLDTNIIISALLFGGNPREVLNRIIRGQLELVLSEDILDELKGVLQRPKFGFPPEVIQIIIAELTAIGIIVRPSMHIKEIKEDKADNAILECAVEGNADCIISGDTHLLDLKLFKTIKIMTPSDFLRFSSE